MSGFDYHDGGQRSLHTKVKTARGRKASSTKWLQRQLNDPYVQRAKREGYRARAAYKLIEIHEKFHLFKPHQSIVDLGAAPGSWLQVAQKLAPKSQVIGIDLLPIDPIDGTVCLEGDFTQEEFYHTLIAQLGEEKLDLVLSDMAAATSGHAPTDHLKTMYLCELAYEFATQHLKEGGAFVAKIFRGGTENELLTDLKKHFKIVKHFKPNASRKDSSEMYLVAMDYRSLS